ncbi:Thioredoxin-related transmembrane protein 4 [Lamellibrachia satsuma]|nr:Thioredoxin-related transmembrane protein 4 [Lamellibrachia satsuma]
MFVRAVPLLVLLATTATQDANDDESVDMPSPLVELSEADWRDMLEGEWLVKLYAPWCPACKVTMHTWRLIANYSAELGVIIGQMDVTKYPGLAGRFMARTLPTIYHVKHGIFRKYPGVDDYVEPVMSFLINEKWQQLPPVPWYRVPTSIPMSLVAVAFRTARKLMVMRHTLMRNFGIPPPVIYAFGGAFLIMVGFVIQWVTEIITCSVQKTFSDKLAAEQRSNSIKTLKGLASDLSEVGGRFRHSSCVNDSSSNEDSTTATHSEAETERSQRTVVIESQHADQQLSTDFAGDRAGVCSTTFPRVKETDSCGDHVKELAPRRRQETASVMDSVYRVCSKSSSRL